MKKAGRACFIGICFMICILPFAGMLFWATDTSTENRELAEFPSLKEGEGWNLDFLQELGVYFNDHFAFRSVLVSIDAQIQSKIFKTSNADAVTVGNDGWLYYTATVDDHLGRDTLSDREIYNIAHNLSMVQEYVQGKGVSFLFTVAPNKNSLYGEHMPYYLQKKVSGTRNMDKLKIKLTENAISYADLFSLFRGREEVLYLKRDSHWNQKGAVLVYDTLLDQLGIDHDSYETVKALRLKETYGDLGNMLYPLAAEPEWDYHYQKDHAFTYQTDTQSTQDAWIETENEEGTGTLLMFRDSFGNTLLPLMADVFAKGYFSRGVPQDVAGYMEKYEPDVVILEKVERNIAELGSDPPILYIKRPSIGQNGEIAEMELADLGTTLDVKENEYNTAYWDVSGVLDDQICTEKTKVYVRVTGSAGADTYEAFLVTAGDSPYGYRLYLPKELAADTAAGFEVIATDEKGSRVVKTTYLHLDSAAAGG